MPPTRKRARPADYAAELQRRQQEAAARITPEAIANGHDEQLRMLRWALDPDANRYAIAACSRRVGKTTGVAGAFLLVGNDFPGAAMLYIVLTSTQAEEVLYNRIWRPMCDKFEAGVTHGKDELKSEFLNGSSVRFVGSDDPRYIASLLGDKYKLVCVDEGQDQPDNVLEPLIEEILPPALSDDGGKLLLTGTIPKVPGGKFYRVWEGGGYERFSWNRFANPHLRDQEQRLEEHLRANPHLTINDPRIRRDWFGEFVWGNDPYQAYDGYAPARNDYDPAPAAWARGLTMRSGRVLAADPWPEVRWVSVAIDPGASDRMSVQANGWGRGGGDVQHLLDWTSDRNANMRWSEIVPLLEAFAAFCKARNLHVSWSYDAGSSKNELDLFRRDTGIGALKAANKADLGGQVRRFNDLLGSGKYKAMRGSPLTGDFQRARWDVKARNAGRFQWAAAFHPDPSEAGRYSVARYFEAPEEKRRETHEEREAAEMRKLYTRPVRQPGLDADLAALTMRRGEVS